MPRPPFGYPGGKIRLADRIVDQMPAHDCYVEPFGGSAAVLLAKPRSQQEVYNDFNEDVVRFFRVCRERPDRLEEYLRWLPYAYTEHQRLLERWYGEGGRPPEVESDRFDDEIVLAAEFLYLRAANHNAMFRRSGFSAGRGSSGAQTYQTYIDRIRPTGERLQGVILENRDCYDVIGKYDGRGTFFYLDPPYHEITDDGMYAGDPRGFDHGELADCLAGLEGRWAVSFDDLPPAFQRDDWVVVEWETRQLSAADKDIDDHTVTERLVLNYDPDAVAPHCSVAVHPADAW